VQLRPGRDRHSRNAGVLRLRASLSNAKNAGSGIEPYVHFLNRDLRFHFKVGSGRSTPRSRKVPIPPLSLRGHSNHQRQAILHLGVHTCQEAPSDAIRAGPTPSMNADGLVNEWQQHPARARSVRHQARQNYYPPADVAETGLCPGSSWIWYLLRAGQIWR
jgi:hypothetical protein